jgi:hypothetical protein
MADPQQTPDHGDPCAECGKDLDDNALEVELSNRVAPWRPAIWVCSRECQDSYLEGYADHQYDAMSQREALCE